jgi:hypothetical protein
LHIGGDAAKVEEEQQQEAGKKNETAIESHSTTLLKIGELPARDILRRDAVD